MDEADRRFHCCLCTSTFCGLLALEMHLEYYHATRFLTNFAMHHYLRIIQSAKSTVFCIACHPNCEPFQDEGRFMIHHMVTCHRATLTRLFALREEVDVPMDE
jgi:hypothetical protein